MDQLDFNAKAVPDVENLPLSPDVKCSVEVRGLDVWITWQYSGNSFEARLGGGGALVELKDSKGTQWLSPPYGKEHTDRVVQWTWWSQANQRPLPAPCEEFTYRFNVTQAGDGEGHFNPTAHVDVYPNGVDVWSSMTDQWHSLQQPNFGGGFTALTRYRVVGDGRLVIRRAIRVGKVSDKRTGESLQLSDEYIEAWTPVRRKEASGPFSAMALGLDADGNATWWYSAATNIPAYPGIDVAGTSGYSIAYHGGGAGPALGLVFGTQKPCSWSRGVPSECGPYAFNSMGWDTGFGMLPAMSTTNLREGDLLDIHLVVIADEMGMQSQYKQRLDDAARGLPAPRKFYATSHLDPVTDGIREQLTRLAAEPSAGIRTENVGRCVRTSSRCVNCGVVPPSMPSHEIQCYSQALLAWDAGARKGPMPVNPISTT